ATERPWERSASAWRNLAMTSSAVWRFMDRLLAPQGLRDSHTTWTSFWGADHEQIAVTHSPFRISHDDYPDAPQAQHSWPDRLVAHRPQVPPAAIGQRRHRLPGPLPRRRPLAIRLGRRFFRLGQTRPLLRLAAAFALPGPGDGRVVQRGVAAHPADEGHPLVQ